MGPRQVLRVYHAFMSLLQNTLHLSPKQQLESLNLLFLCIVFIHKYMKFQEKLITACIQ